jgi:DNA-binding transcriptional MerR regulator
MSRSSHPAPEEGLTIGAVAARTGVGVAVLRAWEARHGFPHPMRLPGGHRRYAEDDVERIRLVEQARAEGLSIDAAIQRVLRRTPPGEPSVFAGIRRRHPETAVVRLSKPAALAVSRAIEDEHLAQAEPAVLVAAFQEERFHHASRARWQELARTAATTAVLATFPASRRVGRTWEVAIDDSQPLRREWLVICDGPAPACFTAWEVPGRSSDGRTFESLWSTDPAVVRAASELAIEVVGARSPEAADDLRASLAPVALAPAPGHADRIAQRAVARLDQLLVATG